MHVHLVHWQPDEVDERAERLREAGYEVTCTTRQGTGMPKDQGREQPAAVVIDLSRLPSHGREVATALRNSAATRHVPLVFVEGQAEKVEAIKERLPDAVYTTWRGIVAALKRAIARPPKQPVVPPSHMAGYSGTPLPKKLGIKPGVVTSLINAPKDFEQTLGPLPDGAKLKRSARGKCNLIVWFVDLLAELEERIGTMAQNTPAGGLWICWPKRTSGVKTDVGERLIREIGLASGLVDYKICAVDETWSGLKFAKRKER